jgi:transcriptional regulator
LKYPPQHHQDNDINHIIEVIKTYPLATLISVKNEELFITHLPLIYNETNGNLIGHIDLYNPQAELLKNNQPVTVIFSGPQCYISPFIYTTTQLPTWNYIKVHLKGHVQSINDSEAIKNSMIQMTEFLEQPDHKYVLEADNPRMDAAINYVKGFEISITHWEGKFKLSQDKKPKDIANAREQLIKSNQESIADFLMKVF